MDIAHERGRRLDRELKKPLGMANFRSVMEWQPRFRATLSAEESERQSVDKRYLRYLAHGMTHTAAAKKCGVPRNTAYRILPRHFDAIESGDRMQMVIGIKGETKKDAHIHELVRVVEKQIVRTSWPHKYMVTVERSNGERVQLPAECLKRPEVNEVK